MGLWDTLGSVGGFLVGGPAGAAAGSALGSAAGGAGSSSGGGSAPSPDLRNNQAVHNDYMYGGAPGAAEGLANMYGGLGQSWANQTGPQNPGIDYGATNAYMGAGNANAGLGMQARGSQADALGMYRDAAMGNGPSVAQQQMRMGNDQAMASQLAMAAGARGQAGLGMAQYNAAGNIANLQTQNNNATGLLRSQEQQAGLAGYAGLGTQMRQGDLGARGMDLQYGQLASNNAIAAGQQGLGYGQLGLGYANMGSQAQLGFSNLQDQVRGRQLGANQGYEGLLFGQYNNQENINQQSRANDVATANSVNGYLQTAASTIPKPGAK